MKIAFVTSGLEPEADGVGDYTRRLASELERIGHTCRLIALNEKGPGEYPRAEGVNILRMNADMPWSSRIALAQETLEEFNPDWTSLQFVCYGFDPKGFIRDRVEGLARLLSSRPAHMMFHEVWAGLKRGAAWKERLAGAIQRKSVLDLVRRIRPRLVTTTNAVYRAVLRKCGMEAEEYPLFGNVDVTTPIPLLQGGEARWRFGFFGTIQLEWSPEPLFSRIAEAARRCGRRPSMLWLGRPGRGERLWNKISRDYTPEMSFLPVGPQPAACISALLNTLDVGISTMPLELIMKSGTAVAMFEHGLPVVVSRREPFRGIDVAEPEEPLICRLDATFTDRLAAGLPHGPRGSRLPEAAARMSRDLEALRT